MTTTLWPLLGKQTGELEADLTGPHDGKTLAHGWEGSYRGAESILRDLLDNRLAYPSIDFGAKAPLHFAFAVGGGGSAPPMFGE